VIVLDCGTGVHGLGQTLTAEGTARGHLLITHTHWDHIQGFPFFAPLFLPGNQWDIYAPGGMGPRLEEALAGQMQFTYFPVTLDQLGATIRYHDLAEGAFQIGNVRVTAQYLNHPALTLGYRIEAGGASVVYATDHEAHTHHQVETDAPLSVPVTPIHQEDERHVEFIAGADLVIHDCQYTAAEYPGKVGWGHSTVEYAVDMAVAGEVKRLAVFHHDPLRHDGAMDVVVQSARQRAEARGSGLDIFGAEEGLIVELREAGRPGSAMATPS
jgi:phosphoribosyl 1,2-cyclic phosphodiesterase